MSESEGQPRTRGNCGGLLEKALVLDLYGRPFLFMLPNRKQKYKSIVGSICTIFILTIVFAYAIYKFDLLIQKEEARVQRSTEEEYFDSNFNYTKEQGFNVAFALDSNGKLDENFNDLSSYGRLRLLFTEQFKGRRETKEVALRPCQVMGDFNATVKGEDTNFYTPAFIDIDSIAPNLLCYDENILLRASNVDGGFLSQLRIMFESCDASWYR